MTSTNPAAPDVARPAPRRPRVIVLGAVNVEMVVSGPALPRPGETVVGGAFAMHDGGRGGNQAVAAARALRGGPLEGCVAIVGAVGDDGFGRDARSALEAEGVDCCDLAVRPGVATGVALVVVDRRGEHQVAVAAGANATLGAVEIEERLAPLIGPDVVVLATLEVPIDAVLAAAYVARAAGARFVLNPAPAQDVPAALLRLSAYVTPNEGELGTLVPGVAGGTEVAARQLALADRELRVAVTLGKHGVLAIGPDVDARLKALDVDVVDPTGAGDAFNGAFAAALAEGRSFVDAVRRARTAGGLAVTKRGVRESMPTRAEIDRAREPR